MSELKQDNGGGTPTFFPIPLIPQGRPVQGLFRVWFSQKDLLPTNPGLPLVGPCDM